MDFFSILQLILMCLGIVILLLIGVVLLYIICLIYEWKNTNNSKGRNKNNNY